MAVTSRSRAVSMCALSEYIQRVGVAGREREAFPRYLAFLINDEFLSDAQANELSEEQRAFFTFSKIYQLCIDRVLRYADIASLTLRGCQSLEWVETLYVLFRSRLITLQQVCDITEEERRNFQPLAIQQLLLSKKISFDFVKALTETQLKKLIIPSIKSLIQEEALDPNDAINLSEHLIKALSIPNLAHLWRRKKCSLEIISQIPAETLVQFNDAFFAMSFDFSRVIPMRVLTQ